MIIFRLILFVFLIAILLFSPSGVIAKVNNSYVTVVIPLRGRDYWYDFKKVIPLIDYLKLKSIPATILVQYENFDDSEVLTYLKKLPQTFELGIFLEVDEALANAANASFLYGVGDRAHSNIILLSAYELDERKRIIDKSFQKFFSIFNFTPKSVGAWYIDTVSQNYLQRKYQITSILDVADQWNTDTYGIWGTPWGIPYLASSINGLIPAQNKLDDSGIIKLQWAARDPIEGYGLTVNNSTYSVQANDYSDTHNLNIDYFNYLSSTYLTNLNPDQIANLTIGLEAGQAGYDYFAEFTRQLNSLTQYQFVTMEKFSEIFLSQEFNLPKLISAKSFIKPDITAFWLMFKNYRVYLSFENNQLIIKDFKNYNAKYLDIDVFKKDENKNLTRIIPSCIDFARFNEFLLLSDSVNDVSPEIHNNEIILNLKLKSSRTEKIIFSEEGIRKSGKLLYSSSADSTTDFLTNIFFKIILDIQTNKNHNLASKIVYSSLNATDYVGIAIYPERFFGFISQYPYIDVVQIPFQVLSKFKKITLDKFYLSYLNSFVKSHVNCKINL